MLRVRVRRWLRTLYLESVTAATRDCDSRCLSQTEQSQTPTEAYLTLFGVVTSTETSQSLVSTDNRPVAQQRALGALSARNRARGLTSPPDADRAQQKYVLRLTAADGPATQLLLRASGSG